MYDEIAEIRKTVNQALSRIDKLIEKIREERDRIAEELNKRMEQLQLGQIDKSQLKDFLDEPYVLIPTKRPDQWYVIVPRWINFHIGWLERETKSYRIFVINKYVRWFTEIPKSIEEKLRFKKPLPFKVQDGMLITGENLQEIAWRKYRKYLYRKEGKDKIKIKKGYEFQLIAQLIEDGTLPFTPKPVSPEDLRPYNRIKLRPYQQEAWDRFLKTGALGIFWAFGSGKSYFGIYALARIKGRKLVVVPSLSLKEQWIERIRTLIPEYQHEIDIETYHAYHKVRDKEYSLICFDECQHLPANTFIRLATLRTKYRLGFSGSAYREDGRENYIIALTGFPIGMAWEHLIKTRVVKKPIFRVYILKTQKDKMRKLEELLRLPQKTIIFCDYIDLGKRISRRFNIPFVYGETKNRLEIIRSNPVCVVSRVGDEGLSFPDIERVIEVAFLYGSRMQESQRFGRLMHSSHDEPEHIILFTEKEFQAYSKRLYAITERGFRIEFIR